MEYKKQCIKGLQSRDEAPSDADDVIRVYSSVGGMRSRGRGGMWQGPTSPGVAEPEERVPVEAEAGRGLLLPGLRLEALRHGSSREPHGPQQEAPGSSVLLGRLLLQALPHRVEVAVPASSGR